MKKFLVDSSILALLLTFFVCNIKADACGGLFESNAGEFDLPLNDNGDGDLECVWIVQLLSRRNVSFTLNRLDSSSATVSLYLEHDASETVITPIRLTSSDVNRSIQTTGQTLIVVLTRSDYSAGLSFTWKSVPAAGATADLVSAVNYVDSEEGRVLWNQFEQKERLTWVLNLPSQNSLTLKAETEFGPCDLVNACWCSYFGIYEIMNSGYLREVTRTCGRSLTLEIEQLYPKLVAFVYINSTVAVTGTDHVELSWATRQPVTEDPWLPSGATTEAPIGCATGNYSNCIQLDCGGLIEMPNFPSLGSFVVEYKPTNEPKTSDHCMWTFDNVANGQQYRVQVTITLLYGGFLGSAGGALSVVNWAYNELYYVPSHVELKFTEDSYKTPYALDKKLFLAYSSGSPQHSGFLVLVDVIKAATFYDGSNYVYNSKSGQASYGPFPHGDFVTIVINPKEASSTFTLDFLNYGTSKNGTCEMDDTFDINEISPKTGAKLLKRSCTNEPSPLSFTSQYPILATFVAFDYTQTTFSISWQ